MLLSLKKRLCYDSEEFVVKNIKHLSVQIHAEFLINTEDTVFTFTTYAPLTFQKGDFQVSKECVFDEQ